MMKRCTLNDFLDDVKNGNVNVEEFVNEVNDEYRKINKRYHPFITLLGPEEIMSNAEKIKVKDELLPFVPLNVKDNICTKGIRTTAGSRILENHVPFFDASAVSFLKKEGCLLFGKTAMDEFGFGTFSTNCAFNIPRNPHDVSRVTGGSSGGAACITALTKYPVVSLAQSTGGSISCPASFCGVVGFTPTYGVVSRYGLIDYASSMDKIGLMTNRVEDLRLPFEIISRKDERDSTCVGLRKIRHSGEKKKPTVGLVRDYFDAVRDERVGKAVMKCVERLESNGMEVKYVSLPSTKYALAAYYIVATAEASTNLAKFCGMRYGYEKDPEGMHFDDYFSLVRSEAFGDEAKRRILLGTFARMAGYRDAYYLKALKIRRMIINEFRKAFKAVDVLIAPTMPIIAPKFKEVEKLSPDEIYSMDILTVAPNFAGMPHLTLPCGKVNSMPVGMHIIGWQFDDWKVIGIASEIEEIIGF